jgi:hypothetical protein
VTTPRQHERWLDRLANRVTPEERKRIEAALIKRIGEPPSKEQRAEHDRRSRAVLGDEWCDEKHGKDFGR